MGERKERWIVVQESPAPVVKVAERSITTSLDEVKASSGGEEKVRYGSVLMTSSGGKSRALGKTHTKLPPALDTTPVSSWTFRFVAIGAVSNEAIGFANLIASLGGICTLANSKFQAWTSCLRIRSVDLWAPSISSVATQTEIYWAVPQDARSKDSAVIQNTPAGVTTPGGLRFKPPAGTLAGSWWNTVAGTGGDAAFYVSLSQGGVLDLNVDFVQSNVVQVYAAFTIATGTLGNTYYLPLDFGSGNKLAVVGRPTTT